jgi:amino acid exporter
VTTYAGPVTLVKTFGALISALVGQQSVPKGTLGSNMSLRGLTIQIINPKAAPHGIAIVEIGLGPDAPLWVDATLVISTIVLSMLGHLAHAVTFSTQTVQHFTADGGGAKRRLAVLHRCCHQAGQVPKLI